MKRYILASLPAVVIAAAIGTAQQSQTAPDAAQGTLGAVVVDGLSDGTYILRVTGGTATVNPIPVIRPGGPPVPPTPVPPAPGPVVDITTAVKAAIASMPDYADKDTHAKQLAFALNLGSSSLSGTGKVNPQVVDAVNEFALSATGNDKQKWAAVMEVIAPSLKASPNMDALRANYQSVVAAIESTLPVSAIEGGEDFSGFPTYGLQEVGANGEWLRFVMELMKQLPALIELIKTLSVLF